MNARVKQPAPGDAQVVQMPNTVAEAPSQKPADAPPPPAAVAPPKKKGNSRRLVLMISVPLILVVAGGYFWLTGGRYEDTDNAYVQQPKVSLSADIAGRIIEVDVKENQLVKAGDVLFRIDPTPYKIALDMANASLASARLGVEQLRVAYTTAQAKLNAAQQTLDVRQRAQGRSTDLATKGVTTQASVDDTLLALQSAQSDVDLDKQGVAGAIAALGGNPDVNTESHPAVQTALAAVENAKRNLDKTTVVAPADGIITQVTSLNVGQFVATGTTIVNLVGTGDTWIQANFKETQLGDLRDGEPADVTVDAYPGVTLHGTVDSIGAATGAEFSLIPAQNATGNWVKVVQRVPVRIKVPASDKAVLRTGMSATVMVDTGKSRLDQMH
jgi:membrane fusion protein (multidrug efflux system)